MPARNHHRLGLFRLRSKPASKCKHCRDICRRNRSVPLRLKGLSLMLSLTQETTERGEARYTKCHSNFPLVQAVNGHCCSSKLGIIRRDSPPCTDRGLPELRETV